MKFTISLYASICLFLFIGCTSKPKQQEVQTNEDISQNNDAKVLEEFPNTDTTLQVIPPIKVTPKKTKPTDNDIQYNITYKGKNNIVKAVDIFKNIQYVPLETNDKSLLASLLTVVICKNGYIYINDVRASGPYIHLFDLNGKFIRDIGKEGEGPEEYITCLSMCVSDNGWVSVTDRGSYSIITYDTEGNFISRIPLKTSPYNVVYLNDSLLLHKGHYDYDGDKYYVINMYKGEIVNSFYPNKFRMFQSYLRQNLTAYEGKAIVAEYTNNEILEVTKDGYKVRYIINVNDKMPPKGFWDQKVKDFTELTTEESTKGYISHIPCFTENERMMFLYFRGSLGKAETEGWALIDKETRKYQTFKRIALSDKLIISPDFFYTQSDGRFTFILSPEEILNSGDEAFISQFPGLKEDDNPILMFAELK